MSELVRPAIHMHAHALHAQMPSMPMPSMSIPCCGTCCVQLGQAFVTQPIVPRLGAIHCCHVTVHLPTTQMVPSSPSFCQLNLPLSSSSFICVNGECRRVNDHRVSLKNHNCMNIQPTCSLINDTHTRAQTTSTQGQFTAPHCWKFS